MEIGETQPLLCDLIDVRGANLAAKAAHIREAEIISDDDEEVGALGSHIRAQEVKWIE